MLFELGVRLVEARVVRDDAAAIAEEVDLLRRRHTFVFTSGGVGPTHDDVTVLGVAMAFGCEVVTDDTLAALIRGAHGDAVTPAQLLMARVPSGATMEHAVDVRWPVIAKENVWLLPGVPEVFVKKLAVVRARIPKTAPFLSKAAFVALEESSLKPLLDRVVLAHPLVQVGSYPKWSDARYKTKVTFDGLDASAVDRALEAFAKELAEGELIRVD
jgi:molybdopterin-biosynthesis enzyme MoeA-like protein